MTEKVQAFYDRHPYPPPIETLADYRLRWQDEGRRRADYHLFWPAKPFRDDLEILVAGCGTSQAARYAIRNPEADVLGVDFSTTSILETEKLKDKYALDNLELRQQPIEGIDEINRQFDLVICTGVLHHLPDPDAGLRALRQVLKPDGAMHLMVYAAYGRAGIYMIQDYCRRLGIGNTEEEITALAATLMTMPHGHPLGTLLGESPDFRRKATLADALLNPQDRAYTVPQLFKWIERTGLQFGRWLRQAPYLPDCGDIANTPHFAKLKSLPLEDQYATLELFRGTMIRHSAVLYPDDFPGKEGFIQFETDEWQHYVPLRLPNTIQVEEHLPEGATAVLINQSHTYPDIYLPVNMHERKLFEAIDGRQDIGELMQQTGLEGQEWVRTFFQNLWRYDQIVFDASQH